MAWDYNVTDTIYNYFSNRNSMNWWLALATMSSLAVRQLHDHRWQKNHQHKHKVYQRSNRIKCSNLITDIYSSLRQTQMTKKYVAIGDRR